MTEHVKLSVLRRDFFRYSIFVFSPLLMGVDTASSLPMYWRGGTSSDWNTASNWLTFPSAVPGASDTANIANAGTAIIDGVSNEVFMLTVSDGGLDIRNGGSLTVGNQMVVSTRNANSAAQLTVAGAGSLLNSGTLFNIGNSGSGTVTIKGGAELKSASVLLGGSLLEGAKSELKIEGSGTSATINTLSIAHGYSSVSRPSAYENVVNITDNATVNVQTIFVGHTGKGLLNIDNAKVTTNSLELGYMSGGQGTINVNGNNAELHVTSALSSGNSSQIIIQNGATLKTDGSVILGNSSSAGSSDILVTSGGLWQAYGNTSIGFSGAGTLRVEKQGVVTGAGSLAVASGLRSRGDIVVTGQGSVLDFKVIRLAGSGQASMLVSNQGAVVTSSFSTSVLNGSYSSVLVTGQGSVLSAKDSMILGSDGKSDVIVADDGRLVSSQGIVLGQHSNGEGTLVIGDGAKAGVVDTPFISGGNGKAEIIFDHQQKIDFNAELRGKLNVTHQRAGMTTLKTASHYEGKTTVSSGILRAGNVHVFSEKSDYITLGNGVLDLNGNDQTIASLENQGNVFWGIKPGTTLTVSGNYQGGGGRLFITSALGDDSSKTDKLIVAGDTSGNSKIVVTNIGGVGARNHEGIKIIEVTGSSDAVFTLAGQYKRNGENTVVAGAYTYRLYQGGVTNPNDGNWYLRSDYEDEGYQAGASVYEVYPQLLLGLNKMPSLHQRVGNRYWNNAGNMQLSQDADAVVPYASQDEAGSSARNKGVWARMEGTYYKVKPAQSTTDAHYDYSAFKMQAGLDGMLQEPAHGTLIGGLTVQYTHGLASVWSRNDSDFGRGRISTDGYGFGATLTWYGDNGFYIDNQAQATWFSSDLSYNGGSSALAESKNGGFGYALSSELGKRFMLNEQWSVTPQAQLSYTNAGFDSFTDVFGANISRQRAASLESRLSLSTDYQNAWRNAQGGQNRSAVYGIANLYAELLNGTQIDVSTVRFSNKIDRWWGGVGFGGSYNWNDDKYSVYGEGLMNTSLKNFGESYEYKATAGFRMAW